MSSQSNFMQVIKESELRAWGLSPHATPPPPPAPASRSRKPLFSSVSPAVQGAQPESASSDRQEVFCLGCCLPRSDPAGLLKRPGPVTAGLRKNSPFPSSPLLTLRIGAIVQQPSLLHFLPSPGPCMLDLTIPGSSL